MEAIVNTIPGQSDSDISAAELEAICDSVDAEIVAHGLPTDEQLLCELASLAAGD